MNYVLVQLYENDGDARVFFNEERLSSWDIPAPPNGKLTRRALTRIMTAIRYKPVGRWQSCDWGAERQFQIAV